MPSINSEQMAREIIANNDHYLDDPRVIQVSKYTNNWGGTTYHLAYNVNEILSLMESPFCHGIEILWTAK